MQVQPFVWFDVNVDILFHALLIHSFTGNKTSVMNETVITYFIYLVSIFV